MKKIILTMMLVVVYALHQDVWNWKSSGLMFGILPVGLAYHAGYSLLAAAMMAILVDSAWPKHLEDTKPESEDKKPENK